VHVAGRSWCEIAGGAGKHRRIYLTLCLERTRIW
jgi:hypothetical protein